MKEPTEGFHLELTRSDERIAENVSAKRRVATQGQAAAGRELGAAQRAGRAHAGWGPGGGPREAPGSPTAAGLRLGASRCEGAGGHRGLRPHLVQTSFSGAMLKLTAPPSPRDSH